MGYWFKIGLRYLSSKKRKTLSVIHRISIAGVAIGVTALLVSLSITSGFQQAFQEKVLGVNAHVLILKYGVDFTEYDRVVERSESYAEVRGAAPFVIHEMMISKGTHLKGVLVKGVTKEGIHSVLDLPQQIVEGSLDAWEALPVTELAKKKVSRQEKMRVNPVQEDQVNPNESPTKRKPEKTSAAFDLSALESELAALEDLSEDMGEEIGNSSLDREPDSQDQTLPEIVIGRTLAKELKLEVGHVVQLVSPLAGAHMALMNVDMDVPKDQYFRVVAIFEAGFQEYDSSLVYVNLPMAQVYQEQEGTVTGVELKLVDLNDAQRIAKQLENDLGGPYHTMGWAELNGSLFEALSMQKIILTIIISSIIVVAAFNVIATLLLLVMEKKKEISILKAMGARSSHIVGIFSIQGLFIGFVGTVLGLILGGGLIVYLDHIQFALDPQIYLIDHLPVLVDPIVIVTTVGVSLLISFAATLLPSIWAARLLPAEGVRPQ